MNLTKPQKLIAAGRLAEAEMSLPPAELSMDPRAEIIRAKIRAEGGSYVDAFHVLESARTRFPQHTPTRLFEGIYLWDADRIAEAEACFESVLAGQPENDLARSYRALCRFAAGDYELAAGVWRKHGFSDNTMFRVRTAEFIELAWLRDRSFMSERPANECQRPAKPNIRKALSQFYRRDFDAMLRYLPEPPATDELAAFLAATAHEMLGEYSLATTYLKSLESRRAEWPDPLIALNARLLTREGKLEQAASEFSKVLIVGPEDFGVNYYLAIICLAYGKKTEARQYFLRAFTSYMVDTREFQWWQLEQVLLGNVGAPASSPAPPQ